MLAAMMSRPLQAFVLTAVSGSSLPLASWLGIIMSPVDDAICAAMMAFGAGALLFAVTVELYAHALHKVAAGHMLLAEMLIMVGAALFGAIFYLFCNRHLDDMLTDDGDEVCDEAEAAEAGSAQAKSAPELEHHAKRSSERAPLLHALKDDEVAKAKAKAKAKARVAAESADASDGHKASPRSRWQKAEKKVVKKIRWVNVLKTWEEKKGKGRTKAMAAMNNVQMSLKKAPKEVDEVDEDEDPEEAARGLKVAFSLFLGLLIDGVPEGILMGFLAAKGQISLVLTTSLFIANFPEAFSSASLMQASMSSYKIIGLWSSLMLIVASLACVSCWTLLHFHPSYGHDEHGSVLPFSVLAGISSIEGLTGGAMIACIATVMLPEAFERSDKDGPILMSSGFLCTAGFLFSAVLKAVLG